MIRIKREKDARRGVFGNKKKGRMNFQIFVLLLFKKNYIQGGGEEKKKNTRKEKYL
jgi:hypothetical protein